MIDPMTVYTWCARLNIAIGGLALLQSSIAGARTAWSLAGLCWTIQAACFFKTMGVSLSGVAPTFGLCALILCLWQGKNLKADYESGALRPRLTAVFLILLALGSLVTEDYRTPSFMSGYMFARLFFLSRPLSLGLTLFALGGAADIFFRNDDPDSGILFQSKQAALLGAVIFLGGEIAGCYWGFSGWGTTWRWSGNFYFSAMLFVLYMVALHVPRSVFTSARAHAWGFFFPLAVIVLAMTLSKVMNL